MFKSKLTALIVSALLACLAIMPMGCSKSNASNPNQVVSEANDFFSQVKISQANGGASFTPSINANPSESVKVPLLSGDIYDVCANYALCVTDKYNKEKVDVFAPTPLTISWESEEQPLYYVFELSTSKKMARAESYVTFDDSITFKYLNMGYDYYYQIQAKFEDRIVKSRIFSFSTAYLPRTIYVDDNVSNTRDWGGYLCGNGTMRVKQGIVYRGGKLEDITAEGKRIMLEDLGIKTDLDVRGDGESNAKVSPLGTSVKYIETKGPYYLGSSGINFDENGGTAEREVFKQALITEIRAFADPNNFPIYIHCSLGRDRTGTLCFLINALLGVSEIDLYRDYEISFMSRTGSNGHTMSTIKPTFDNLYNYIKRYSYGNLAKNAEKYMLDLGITQAEIDAIKENMLEYV